MCSQFLMKIINHLLKAHHKSALRFLWKKTCVKGTQTFLFITMQKAGPFTETG